jgi:hypothetical protein
VTEESARSAALQTLAMLNVFRTRTPLFGDNWSFLIDISVQIAVAILIALTVLALRSRIKRG